jgi:hypothetical protein
MSVHSLEKIMSFAYVLKIAAIVGAVSVCSVIGCGGDTSSGTGSGTPSGGNTTGGSSFTGSCCLNGSFYSCPTEDDVSKCSLDTGPGNCTADSSKDNTCT